MNAGNHAQKLHDSAVVIDGHSDIPIPIAEGKMRLGDRVEVPDPATSNINGIITKYWLISRSEYSKFPQHKPTKREVRHVSGFRA
jgi:hypothetical protein